VCPEIGADLADMADSDGRAIGSSADLGIGHSGFGARRRQENVVSGRGGWRYGLRGIIDYRLHVWLHMRLLSAGSGRGREQPEGAGTLHGLAAAVRAELLVRKDSVLIVGRGLKAAPTWLMVSI